MTLIDWFLDRQLSRFVKHGALTIVCASGRSLTYGDGSGERVIARFTSKSWQRRVLLNPALRLGEAYMEGGLVMHQGSIAEFIALLYQNVLDSGLYRWVFRFDWLRGLLLGLLNSNSEVQAKRNVGHHYDLDSRLFGWFLDADRQYSCAYYESPTMSLDEAQLAKKRHIAAKLLLKPGQRVLEIGSGYGGLALYLAEQADVNVLGVTLSKEQLAFARARVTEKGLQAKVDFSFQDYRHIAGRFERIVSIAMFEQVGKRYRDPFLRKCFDLLADDGIMLLHTIGRLGRIDRAPHFNPWVLKYIFPGAYVPSLPELVRAIERSGFTLCDIEVLRLHYAETLRTWRDRFLSKRDEVLEIYDERFARMWEFYLAGCELPFRYNKQCVFQIQFSKKNAHVPATRQYIYKDAHIEQPATIGSTHRTREFPCDLNALSRVTGPDTLLTSRSQR